MTDLKELARASIAAYLRYIAAVAVDSLPTTSDQAKELECEMNAARDAMFNGVADAQAEIARLRGALEAEFPVAPNGWFDSEQEKRESDEYFRGVADALAFVRGQALK